MKTSMSVSRALTLLAVLLFAVMLLMGTAEAHRRERGRKHGRRGVKTLNDYFGKNVCVCVCV